MFAGLAVESLHHPSPFHVQTCSLRMSLQVGEMTDAPIKTRFGYHIILVEGRK